MSDKKSSKEHKKEKKEHRRDKSDKSDDSTKELVTSVLQVLEKQRKDIQAWLKVDKEFKYLQGSESSFEKDVQKLLSEGWHPESFTSSSLGNKIVFAAFFSRPVSVPVHTGENSASAVINSSAAKGTNSRKNSVGPPKQGTPPVPKKEEKKENANEGLSIIQGGVHKNYELLRELGRGAFSTVYKARKKTTGEEFAIKAIKKSSDDDEEEGNDIEQLKREIQIMKRVDHPNVVKLYEVYEEEEEYYLVLELITGKELFERIVERGQYSEREASEVVRQLVSAVAYLHEKGIAHRDLKPENLLSAIMKDGREVVKIVDFGFSKRFGEDKLSTSVGTPGYVAPEVLTAESYDNSVDMWSVGVIVYILLCGYPPFYAETPPELFTKIMQCKYDFDDPAWENVSEAAKNLIRNLLVKDTKKRWTAKQCLEDPWVKGISVGGNKLTTGTKLKDKDQDTFWSKK